MQRVETARIRGSESELEVTARWRPQPHLPLRFSRSANISKRFGGTVALDGIDWSVAPGEVHCLVGENGSGKSTLIKILTGVHAPDPGGEITIDGVAHAEPDAAPGTALGIQVIFQDLSLFPNLTVEENIAIDLELGGAAAAAAAAGDARRPRRRRSPGSMPTFRSMRRVGSAAGRAAPDRRDLPRPGRQCPHPVHGRTDRLADPARGRPAARDGPAAEGAGRRRRLRQPPARGGRSRSPSG